MTDFQIELDVASETSSSFTDLDHAGWLDTVRAHGLETEQLSDSGPAGGWPVYRVWGERDALVQFSAEHLSGGSAPGEEDYNYAASQIEKTPT